VKRTVRDSRHSAPSGLQSQLPATRTLQRMARRRTELAVAAAAAAAFPLRLALHYASPPPPSRPMAALILAHQSRGDNETTHAGYDTLPPPDVPGRVA
jgi:hypothetical protein